MTNSIGVLVYRQNFDLFGNLLGSEGDGGSSYGYAGEWTDGTRLQHLRARYYSTQQGRFTSTDPFPGILTEPASLTPYTYALNNPVMYSDPSGETPLMLLGILGGLLGGTIYGYGSQVIRNFSQGICFWNAFSYNIDAGQIALFAGVGTVMGLGMGGAMVGAMSLVGYLGFGTSVHQVISSDGDLTNEVKGLIQPLNRFTGMIYRNASGSPSSLTPRPGIDDVPGGGLSFFNSIEKLNPGKYVAIDASKLQKLTAVFDNDPLGHVTVTPPSLIELQAWLQPEEP